MGEMGVGVGGVRWDCSAIVGEHIEPRWHTDRQLTTPRLQGATKGHAEGEPGERHQHPRPNPPAPLVGWFQKPDPLFLPVKSPLLPIMHHLFSSLCVILQQQKGQAFVVAHSVTQTQDPRLPVIKWKLSLGLSQRSLCSCQLKERGGNSYFCT